MEHILKSVSIYFNIRRHYRKRQEETISNLPDWVNPIRGEGDTMEDHKIIHYSKGNPIMAAKSFLTRSLPFPNIKHVPRRKLSSADLIYSWGAVILNDIPYVLELDNPVVLAFYNWGALKFPPLRKYMEGLLNNRNCRSIICISQACKEGMAKIFGKQISSKCEVLYPFIEQHKASKHSPNVEFLFVSTQFYLKGGKELLKAFTRVCKECPKAHLTIVSNTPKKIVEDYGKNPKITFVPANLSKKELHSRYYAKADIFVLPTYKDSFGMVVLEALSFGLPVISTNLYAIPEMVLHGKNGFLIEPPIRYFTKDNLPSDKFWSVDMEKYASEHNFPEFEDRLEEHMLELARDSERVKKMSEESSTLFREKFSPKVRLEKFEEIVKGALEH